MNNIVTAFNEAANGALVADRAESFPDRGSGKGTIRLEISGKTVLGAPFHHTSLPISSGADLPAVASAMAHAARSYASVKPIVQGALMTAKAQGFGTAFDGLMARLDRVATSGLKPVEDAIARFEASAATNANVIAKTIDAARVAFEDKINRMTNGGPEGPLDESPKSPIVQPGPGDA